MSFNSSNTNNYATRFRPDFRYVKDKTELIELNNFISTTPSSTDKEAYRLALASFQGELKSALGSGKIDSGSYSIPSGKDYDSNFDFSFLRRPDLTIVEFDDYMNAINERLQNSNVALTKQMEKELAAAQAKRAELIKQDKDTADSND